MFNRIQIESFFKKYDHINDQIFVAYKKYFMKNYIELISANLNKLNEKNGDETFKYNYTQWKFISQLSEKCKTGFSFNINDFIPNVYNDVSIGGDPWTQYEFGKNIYNDGLSERVYYRLEWRKTPDNKSGYCLRLCLHSSEEKINKHIMDLAAKK